MFLRIKFIFFLRRFYNGQRMEEKAQSDLLPLEGDMQKCRDSSQTEPSSRSAHSATQLGFSHFSG